jgi:hypothetical protein
MDRRLGAGVEQGVAVSVDQTREAGPCTLEEAVLRCCDPAAVSEMTSLSERGFKGPIMAWFPGELTDYERNVLRYEALREQLEKELTEKLKAGTLIAAGYDSRAPIDAAPTTIPGDRWRVLKPNFADSSASTPHFTITGILVTSGTAEKSAPVRGVGRLAIGVAARRVRLDGRDLRLSPRSFSLLLMLARAARERDAAVPKQAMEDQLLAKNAGEKALSQSIHKLKEELIQRGVDRDRTQALIENQRAVGYRLTLSSSEIEIDG